MDGMDHLHLSGQRGGRVGQVYPNGVRQEGGGGILTDSNDDHLAIVPLTAPPVMI